jgi:O-antigen ligase
VLGYGLLIIAFISIGFYFIAIKLLGTNLDILVGIRAKSFLSVGQDVSIGMRLGQNLAIWEKIKSFPLFGEGLGALVYITPFYKVNWIDNTYFVLLWKFGVLGFTIFVCILLFVLKKSYYIYRNTKDIFYKCFAVGVFSTFVGFSVLGFISPVLIKYRFNIVWAVLFGLTYIIEKSVKKEKALPEPKEDEVEVR